MLLGIRWGSLRTKIITWSFVPTAIILVAVAVVIFYAYQDVTEDLVIERNRELTRLSTAEFAAGLTEYTGLLAEYAGLLGGLPRIAYAYEGDLIVQRDVLKLAKSRFEVFDGGVLILSNQGTVVAAEPERPEVMGQNWASRSYFRQMLHAPRPVFSDIVADGPGGAEVIVVAMPITSHQGQFLGIMAGMFRLGATRINPFYRDIKKLRISESSSAYLVDSNGRLIYHSDTDLIGDDFWEHAIVQQVLKGHVGALRTRALDGQDTVTSFAPVPDTSWGLVTQESWATLTKASRGYGQFLLLLLALGVVAPALIVTIGIRRLTRPITELIGAAQEVAKGDFDQTITAQTGDEIEELAEQFNLMAAQLQESYAHLEQRVADRTKELAALNAVAQTVGQSLELKAMLTAALGKVLEVLEFESGGIYLKDLKTDGLLMICHCGLSGAFRRVVAKGIISARVAESGNPIIVDDLSKEPNAPRELLKEGHRSVASIPLLSKGQVQGVLTTASRQLRRFDQQDVELLLSIGHQIGVAIENARLFNAVQRRAEQFRVISEVGRHITSILDENELLEEIVRLLKKTFGYYLITIGLIEGDEVVFKAGAKTHWDEAQFLPPPVKVGVEGITAWVAATGEPLLASDVSQEPQFLFLPDAAETRSELAVPLKLALSSAEGTKTAVIGVLNVESDQLNAFDESDVAVLQSLAHQAAVAIENARLFRNTARQVRELRALAEASRIISSVLDQDQLLQSFYEQITRIAPTDFYLIALYDEATNVVSIEINVDEGVHYPKQQYVLDKGLLKLVIHNKQPLRFDSLTEEKHKLDVEIVPVGSPKVNHGWLGVPMLYGDKVLGALVVGSYQRGAFDEGHQQTLTSIANQAAVALENARLFTERERRLDEMAVLNEVGQAISSSLRLDELLDLIHRQVSRVMDTTNLFIALYDKEEDWVSFPLYVDGDQVRRHSRGRKAGQGLTEHIIRSRQPLLLPDDVGGRMQELGIEVIGTSARSWLGVPMIAGDEVLGVIAVQSYTTENVYDEEHLNLLPTIAAQAAIAIENARLYEQAQQLAVMEERQRLARELHDAVTQTLFSASLIAEALPTIWESDQDEGQQLLQDLRQLSRGALAEMRTLLMELRPAALVEANLRDLLRQLGEAVAGRTGLPVTVTVEGDTALPDDVHVALYRIAQEALNNVVKHAQASQVAISLRGSPTPGAEGEGKSIELQVSDDGRGFDTSDVEPGELGLGIMHERAQAIGATLEIESQPGHGTQVSVVWERTNDQ